MDQRTAHCTGKHDHEGGGTTTNYFSGEIIYDAVLWNHTPMTTDWYIPMIKKEALVIISLKQVLIIDMTIKRISDKNMLLNKCIKKQAAN